MNSASDFQPFERVFEVGFENTLPILSPNKHQTVTQTEPVSPLKPSQKLNRMNDALDPPPMKWEHIRELDDDEKWYERTQVITKQEHQFYIHCAKEFLEDLLFEVTENVDKMPSEEKNEEYKYMEDFTDEDFYPASNNLDVEYLEKHTGSSSDFKESAFARQSLYVKFDPLIGANPPVSQPPVIKAPPKNKLANDLLVLDTPPPIQSKQKASKVHFAAVNEYEHFSDDPESNTASTKSPSCRTDSSDTDPSISKCHMDDQCLGTSNEELVKVLKFTEADVARQIEESLSEEKLKSASVQKQIHLEYKNKLKALEEEKEAYRSQFALVVGEREGLQIELDKWKSLSTVAVSSPLGLAEKNAELKRNIDQMQKQRDQALSDYEALEKSFGEFHNRYFKLKECSEAYKKRDSLLEEKCSELNAIVKEGERLMASMTEEMRLKQEEVNEMVQKNSEKHASEVTVLKTEMKKMALELDSLKKALEQKDQEKTELASICDELVKELGKRQV